MSIENPKEQLKDTNPWEQNKNLSEEQAEIVKELFLFSGEHGNPLYFEDLGSPLGSDSEKEIFINEEVLKGLDEEKKEDAKFTFDSLRSFLKGPIFTDTFHKNHRDLSNENKFTRHKWEMANKDKLSNEALKYYQSNRLNFNKCNQVINSLSVLEDYVLNPEIKGQLSELKGRIPSEFLEQDEKEKILKYSTLEDDEKIRVVEELTEIARDTINLLSEK